MKFVRTVHKPIEAPIFLDRSEELELIDLLANSDAVPPVDDEGNDLDGMPVFGRAQDGAIWCVGNDGAYCYREAVTA